MTDQAVDTVNSYYRKWEFSEPPFTVVSGELTISGATGWFDDGENFRTTVTDGVITNIGDSISGGYYQI